METGKVKSTHFVRVCNEYHAIDAKYATWRGTEMHARTAARQIVRTTRLSGLLLATASALLPWFALQARPQAQPAAKNSAAQGTTTKKPTGAAAARPAYDRA